MSYEAVFFDVDGTLIDSAPGIKKTFAYTFQKLGIDDRNIDYNQFFGPPLRRSYAKYLPDAEAVERAVTLYRAYYRQEGRHMCTLYPGVADMLKTLRSAGKILCTATSKPVTVVTPILRELQIADCFDYIGGASEDASIDTKTAVIRQLLTHAEFQGKSILMVGDRKDDMIGAADCGLSAAGVLYGYGGLEELAPYDPQFLAKDCQELTKFILEGDSNE